MVNVKRKSLEKEPFSAYLRSVRNLHTMSISEHLPENYNEFIDEFEKCFNVLNVNYQMSMTLKVHIVIHHYGYFSI